MKYLIDLKTGGTIAFSVFKDDEKAMLYGKARNLSVIGEDGKVDGTFIMTKEIADSILNELQDEIKEENKPKKTRKNGTK